MTALVLLRHGQASFGAQRYDALSELGHRQGEAVGAHLAARGRPVMSVHVGPRQRHRETEAALRRAWSLAAGETLPPALPAMGLDEFADSDDVLSQAQERYGAGFLELPRAEQMRHYDELLAQWCRGERRFGHGPDVDTFRARVRLAIDELADAPVPGQSLAVAVRAAENGAGTAHWGLHAGPCVLAVTSAGVVAAAVAEVMGLGSDGLLDLLRVLRNASLTELHRTARGWRLHGFNGVAHLPLDQVTGL